MKPLSWLCLLAGAAPVFSSVLKPLVAYDVKYVDVPEKRHIDIDHFSYIEGRNRNLGTVSLAKTFPAKDVLFNVALGKSKGDASGSLSISVTCISCYTTGTAVVTTEGVKKDESVLGGIIDFFKHPDPRELVVDALDLNLEVNLENLGGHFEFDISFAASGTYTVTLFRSETPVGVALNDDDKIGLLFTLELLFTVSAAVDFSTGFDVVFPKGASFVLNPLNGKIVSMNIGGVQVKSIPVKLVKGAACISAILRLKFQVGVGLKVLGKGFDFEAGVFFDPIQYKACITYDPKKPCKVEFTENFFEEIGAYARAVVDLDFAKFSAGPTAVSTFFTGALPSTCISSSNPTTTKALPKTSPPVLKQTEDSDKSKTVVSKTIPKQTSPTSTHSKAKETDAPSPTAPGGAFHTAIHSGHESDTSDHGKHTSKEGSGSSHHTASSHHHSAGTGSIKPHHKPTSPSQGPYGNSTSDASGGVPTGSDSSMTTSTITTTSVYTITSCKPEVTDCPGKIGQVTSEVIITTTVCPVSGASPTSTGIADGEVGDSSAGPLPTGNKASNSTTSALDGSDLTTRTIYSTETYTITSCLSQYIHCPASLESAIVQTKTVVQYTTVCPVSQTEFPSTLPTAAAGLPTGASETAKGVAPAPTAVPVVKTIVIVSPVPLTPCETPIVRTFESYVPPYATSTFAGNVTGEAPYPTANSTAPVALPTSTKSSPPEVVPTEEALSPTVVREVAVPTAEDSSVKAGVQSSSSAAPSAVSTFQQANGVSGGSAIGLLQLVAVAFVGVAATLMY
ncbi:uncharacterized protein BP5553_08104 [Venustampulla echinocandica]|uniref:Uncharacterized protein n=1 Tax=Venustampulla echinocandica TaxID=2656787 RepID=A0A370TFR5_9HELO|nr:uncharacterized protein BP5553_08104 [Venustampulla echinocandica]RDL33736.1 hypothetical protein BP5553_08104 [Venustampulla echinocandica]